MANQEQTERSSIAKSAFRVMAGGVFSLSAGLINQVVIAAFYGASAGMDAYLTALVIPAYFQLVLLSGLSFVFIPAFVREDSSGKEDDAWALAGTFIWITAIILSVIALAGALFSAQIIALSAPGFSPEKSAIAARMLSILMFTIPFGGIGSLTIGIQNARNRFFWPSFGGALNSIGNVVVVLVLFRSLGPFALCWGFLAATIVQAGITAIPVIRHGWKYPLSLSDPRVIEMGKLLAPFLFFGLLVRSSAIFERYFASGLPDGQISYLGYASKISSIFVSLLASGIGAAIFPAMARAYAQSGLQGLVEKNRYGLRLTSAVVLPAVMVTTALSVPLVQILFEHGAFHTMDTLNVCQIIFAALLSDVLFRMIGNINAETSYILKDTLMPSIVAALSMLIYIGTGKFFVSQWGYVGLAYARPMQQGLSILCVWIFLLRKMPEARPGKTVRLIVQYLLAAAVAFLCGRLILIKLPLASAFLQLTAGAAGGFAVYLLILFFRDRDIFSAILDLAGFRLILNRVLNRKPGARTKYPYKA